MTLAATRTAVASAINAGTYTHEFTAEPAVLARESRLNVGDLRVVVMAAAVAIDAPQDTGSNITRTIVVHVASQGESENDFQAADKVMTTVEEIGREMANETLSIAGVVGAPIDLELIPLDPDAMRGNGLAVGIVKVEYLSLEG
jgi:hypothetical protein